MALKGRRKTWKTGDRGLSTGMILPAALEPAEYVTVAADRILLVDPRGEISEEDLQEFLEKEIEPRFWPWLKKKEKEKRGREVIMT